MFCPIEDALPLPALDRCLKAKTTIAGSFPSGAIPIGRAYDACGQAMEGKLGPEGTKALFAALAQHGEFDGEAATPEKKALQCFNVLMFDRARPDRGSELLTLLKKCENAARVSDDISIQAFKDALKEAGLVVEDAVWRPVYADQSRAGQIDMRAVGEVYQNMVANTPAGSVSESGFLIAVADAFMAEFAETSKQLRRELEAQRSDQEGQGLRWTYSQIKKLVETVAGGAHEVDVKHFFSTCVEYSQACTQADHVAIPMGQVREVPDRYGGDLLPDEVVSLAACATQILTGGSGRSAVGDTPRTQASNQAPAPAEAAEAAAKSPKKKK